MCLGRLWHMFLDSIGECPFLRYILGTRCFGSWLYCFRQVECHYTDQLILLSPSDDRTGNLVREVAVPRKMRNSFTS